MNFKKHLVEQPFIAATGLAALVHSTWSLSVLFTGLPPVWEPYSYIFWAKFLYWLIPGLLIAYALDVGQIVTSGEIRSGQRTTAKYMTFLVFAMATYYLQWLYIAHHMPALELGAGVYTEGFASRVVLLTRNGAIWLIPALLPISTAMYTLSGNTEKRIISETPESGAETEVIDVQPEQEEEDANPKVNTLSIRTSRMSRKNGHSDQDHERENGTAN